MITLRCLLLAAVLPGASSSPGAQRLGAPARADTSIATDTVPPVLTLDLLTRVQRFLEQWKREPPAVHALAHDSANCAHFVVQRGTFPGQFAALGGRTTLTAAVVDFGAVAAKSPAVAEDFRRAHLAPGRYLPFIKALTFAEATDTIQVSIDGMEMADDALPSSDVIWQNVGFLEAHQNAVDALGLALPKEGLRLSGAGRRTFLDTAALATHRVRIREIAGNDGFSIGFLDSTEAPGGMPGGPAPRPLRVLFLGNSLTYYNAMPRMFGTLAAQGLRRRVVVGLVSLPGASSYVLWEGTDVRQIIARLPWDYLVVQLKPIGAPTRRDFQRYARLFTQQAAAYHARAVVWTQFRAPDTQVAEQVTLDTTLAAVAKAAGAGLAPIPAVWETVQQASDSTWRGLYFNLATGNTHPSPMGSYLMALVFYRAITGQSPVGLAPHAGAATLSEREAALLQRAAVGGP